ncbi:MAG: lectin-like protein [Phycisphaerales bacterium]
MLSLRCAGAVGVFVAAQALAQSNPVALNYNFNGLAHPGEFTGAANPGVADDINGYRSISDRGLYINGASGSFGTAPIIGATGLPYQIIRDAFVNDLVMLGNRNALWPFDLTLDGDNRGIQPIWLPNPDLSGPQETLLDTPILLDETSQIGLLFQISNNGGSFNVVLTCTDFTTATVRVAGPDWFGSANPVPAAGSGVQSQTRLGTFNSAGNFDNPTPSGALNVIESVITVARMLNDGIADLRGKQLQSITFQDRFDQFGAPIALGAGNRSFAVLAATVGGVAAPANDLCSAATPIDNGTFNGSTGGAGGATTSACGFADTADVWYRYTASTTGMARASLCGSGFDTTISVYTGSCAALGDPIACNDNLCDLASRVDFPVVQGSSYLVRVAGSNGDRGAFTLVMSSPPGVLAGPFINPSNGHAYYLLNFSSWPDAENDAIALGGHLVTINDAAENAWVLDTVLNFDGGAVFRRGWIGLQRTGGIFSTWADGEPVGFTNWAAGEPNNSGGLEAYAEMIQQSGLWNDARELPGSSNFGIVEIPVPPAAPIGSGSAAPALVGRGSNTFVSVRVTRAGGEPNTITSVAVDASAIGAGTLVLNDDGLNGDPTPGDDRWSATLAVPFMAPTGPQSLPFTITDAQNRMGTGTIDFTVEPPAWDELADGFGDAGDLPASAQVISGPAGELVGAITGALDAADSDMYFIRICDPASFSASTLGGASFDTQLFLFGTDGLGVTFNDDSGTTQSRITGAFVPAAGDYYLAVSRYDRDPVDEFGQELWIDTPFGTERAPDGAGAASPIFAWNAAPAAGGAYRVTLTGACFIADNPCTVDFNNDGDVNADDLGDFINCYFAVPPCDGADFNRDGDVNADDLGDFINAYFAGC